MQLDIRLDLDLILDKQTPGSLHCHTSFTLALNTWAPQRCVLSPLLFMLYIHTCNPKQGENSIVKFAHVTTMQLLYCQRIIRRARQSMQKGGCSTLSCAWSAPRHSKEEECRLLAVMWPGHVRHGHDSWRGDSKWWQDVVTFIGSYYILYPTLHTKNSHIQTHTHKLLCSVPSTTHTHTDIQTHTYTFCIPHHTQTHTCINHIMPTSLY